jgi:hypothetical protein
MGPHLNPSCSLWLRGEIRITAVSTESRDFG